MSVSGVQLCDSGTKVQLCDGGAKVQLCSIEYPAPCICPEDAAETYVLKAGAWTRYQRYTDGCPDGTNIDYDEWYVLLEDVTLTKFVGECQWRGNGSTQYLYFEELQNTQSRGWDVRLCGEGACDPCQWHGGAGSGALQVKLSGDYPHGTYEGAGCIGAVLHTGEMIVEEDAP